MFLPNPQTDRERFQDCWIKLRESIADPKLAHEVYLDLEANYQTPEKLGLLASVIVRICLQHIYQNFPLELPQVVIDAYLAAGPNLEIPLATCEQCGYGLPRTFQACPLCNGRVGVGAYALRRGAAALNN